MSGAFKAVTGAIFGGDSKPVEGANFAPISSAEQGRLSGIEDQINQLFGEQGPLKDIAQNQSSEVQQLFANNLKTFLTNNGQASPQDIQKASDFVDQTFTNPTQQVVNQNVADYGDQAAAKAAALGRNPNADIATQQAIAGEGLRQNIGLQAERGSRIQSNVNDQYTRSLGSLNAGMQGSGYLNNLAQQAFTNQMNLQNAKTGLAQFYQNERGQKAAGVTSSPGLLGYASAIGNTMGNLGKGIGSLMGGSGGGSSAPGQQGLMGAFGASNIG